MPMPFRAKKNIKLAHEAFYNILFFNSWITIEVEKFISMISRVFLVFYFIFGLTKELFSNF
jgi:hypothetical protein